METPLPQKHILRKWIVQILKFILAAGLISWVLCDINFADLKQLATGRIVFFTVLAGAAIGIQLVLCAVRWQILLRIQRIEISFLRALSLSMQGTFFSLCMPGGAVGGDVVDHAGIGILHHLFDRDLDRDGDLLDVHIGVLIGDDQFARLGPN